MTPRFAGGVLWAVLLLVAPFPLFGLEGVFVPTARYGQLAAALSLLGGLEGTEGVTGLFMGLLWAHALVFAAVLAAIVWGLRRALPRFVGAQAAACLLALALGALVWGIGFAEYRSAFHHTTSHASLSELYR